MGSNIWPGSTHTIKSSSGQSKMTLDFTSHYKQESIMNMCYFTFLIVLFGFLSTDVAKQLQGYIAQPIERMVYAIERLTKLVYAITDNEQQGNVDDLRRFSENIQDFMNNPDVGAADKCSSVTPTYLIDSYIDTTAAEENEAMPMAVDIQCESTRASIECLNLP